MRALYLVGAIALVGCNPPVNNDPGQFETIPLATIENPACVFNPVIDETVEATSSIEVAFATYQDNPDYMAVARYKGETLKLVPREVPSFDQNTFDVTYDVVDYLKWQIRVTSADGAGEMRLLQDGQPSDTALAIRGGCQ